jgi:hypothetical protein
MCCAAEACDSFSKEDMVANGLASGRSSFYDLVHPTHSREATEQAHAAIGSSGSSAGPGAAAAASAAAAGAAAAGAGVPPPGPAVGAAAMAAGAAGLTPQRQPSQPMAITGVSDCGCMLNQQCIIGAAGNSVNRA